MNCNAGGFRAYLWTGDSAKEASLQPTEEEGGSEKEAEAGTLLMEDGAGLAKAGAGILCFDADIVFMFELLLNDPEGSTW